MLEGGPDDLLDGLLFLGLGAALQQVQAQGAGDGDRGGDVEVEVKGRSVDGWAKK